MKDWSRRLRRFRRLSLKLKMMLFSSMLVLLCMAVIFSVTYNVVSRNSREQMEHSMDLALAQAQEFVDFRARLMMYASAVVNYNADLQEILTRSLTQQIDTPQQIRDMLSLEKALSALEMSEYIYQPCLYVHGDLLYANQNLYFRNLDEFALTPEYRKLMDSRAQVLWLPPENEVLAGKSAQPVRLISLLRKIRSTENVGAVLSVQKISILAEDIDSIVEKSTLTSDGTLILQTGERALISCSNPALYESIAGVLETPGDWTTCVFGGKDYRVKSCTVPTSGWMMTAVIPFSEITRDSRHIAKLMLWMVLAIELCACLASYCFAESISRRLRRLMYKMNQVRQGDFSVSMLGQQEDEIGDLGNAFNFMTRQLSTMARQQYESGKAIKQAELRALQAQINPHFLYNTLDLISWEAMAHQVPEISRIAIALARYYKLSLGKGQDMVTLADEIAHVTVFIEIQNYRFDHRLRLIDQVSEELRGVRVPKLMLQPIVENAVLHGLLARPETHRGTIVIDAGCSQGIVTVTVKDNGVGMDPATLSNLMTRGYGIPNIDKRLKLCFGESYGLTYASIPDVETTCTLRFPRVE